VRSSKEDDVLNLRQLHSFVNDTLAHSGGHDASLWREWMNSAGDKPVHDPNSAFSRMQCLYVRHKGWPEPEACRMLLGVKEEQVTERSGEAAAVAAVSLPNTDESVGSVGIAAPAPPPKKSRVEACGRLWLDHLLFSSSRSFHWSVSLLLFSFCVAFWSAFHSAGCRVLLPLLIFHRPPRYVVLSASR